MKTFFCAGGFFVALGLAAVNPALAADQAPSNNLAAVDGSDQEARLVSAFFGLDNVERKKKKGLLLHHHPNVTLVVCLLLNSR